MCAVRWYGNLEGWTVATQRNFIERFGHRHISQYFGNRLRSVIHVVVTIHSYLNWTALHIGCVKLSRCVYEIVRRLLIGRQQQTVSFRSKLGYKPGRIVLQDQTGDEFIGTTSIPGFDGVENISDEHLQCHGGIQGRLPRLPHWHRRAAKGSSTTDEPTS